MDELIKVIRSFVGRHDLYTVYRDFLELTALAFSNKVDKENFSDRESMFLQTAKKYNDEEMKKISEMGALLVNEMDKNGFNDYLGDLLMKLELGNKLNGQFFTPYHLGKLTASLSINKKDLEKKIKEKGYITINEPCVGGGAMIIAIADVMKELGYNPQTQLLVVCNDLDIRNVHTAYIQLFLFGIPAVVMHQNTLTMEKWSTWKTIGYYLNSYKFYEEFDIKQGGN